MDDGLDEMGSRIKRRQGVQSSLSLPCTLCMFQIKMHAVLKTILSVSVETTCIAPALIHGKANKLLHVFQRKFSD